METKNHVEFRSGVSTQAFEQTRRSSAQDRSVSSRNSTPGRWADEKLEEGTAE
jgi:hypothetical protein